MSTFYKLVISGALRAQLGRRATPSLAQRLTGDRGGGNPTFCPSRTQSSGGGGGSGEKQFNVPPSAEFVARVSGIATMAKLPYRESAEGLDAAFVGVPIDTGTSNRPGARAESALLRAYNSGTRAAPYESLMVADIGDINVNLYDLKDTCRRNPERLPQDPPCRHQRRGAGGKIGHGNPFRRCVEEGPADCKRVVQIGLRGTGYSPDSYEWSRAQGFRVVQVEECWFKSLAPLMAEVRAQMGSGPVYLSFDIDALDPGFAPGTGTPEIAGLTPIQGVEIVRGCSADSPGGM
ncbi:hypothetical protein CRUP_021027 [Coryphaenoides rupestris]|nr:hypothetical protein CRUP_021027 [Coryphaenoides rupestris]